MHDAHRMYGPVGYRGVRGQNLVQTNCDSRSYQDSGPPRAGAMFNMHSMRSLIISRGWHRVPRTGPMDWAVAGHGTQKDERPHLLHVDRLRCTTYTAHTTKKAICFTKQWQIHTTKQMIKNRHQETNMLHKMHVWTY